MTRKIAIDIADAFARQKPRSIKNTMTDGTAVYLHGHKIMQRDEDGGYSVNLCGYNTVTTRSRLNDLMRLLGLSSGIYCRKFEPFLNGSPMPYNGWVKVS